MANRLAIRYGSTIPTTDDLIGYEMGYCTTDRKLYVNDNGTVRVLAPGNTDFAQGEFYQLFRNGDLHTGDDSYWSVENGTLTVSSNELTVTKTGSADRGAFAAQTPYLDITHKYFFSCDAKSSSNSVSATIGFFTSGYTETGSAVSTSSTTFAKISFIGQPADTTNIIACRSGTSASATNSYCVFKNIICIDLTSLYGIGNEPATVDEFTSLYTKSYYPYHELKIVISTTDFTSAMTYKNTGVVLTINSNCKYAFHVFGSYYNSRPKGIAIVNNATTMDDYRTMAIDDGYAGVSISGWSPGLTYYVWAKFATATTNRINVRGWMECYE